MKKGRQRPKGGAYELVVAKLFTEQYYPNNEGVFKRVPKSGGWDKRIICGDISPFLFTAKDGGDGTGQLEPDSTFPFSIECKNWNAKNVKHFFSGLYSAESAMFDWVEQAKLDSIPTGKLPMVVFKLYGKNNIAILSQPVFNDLLDIFGVPDSKFYTIFSDEVFCTFILLSEVFSWIDFAHYRG